jgi:hypothetical protein
MLRNRLQITFQKENDSSQASAVFSAQNAQVKNCACLIYISKNALITILDEMNARSIATKQ